MWGQVPHSHWSAHRGKILWGTDQLKELIQVGGWKLKRDEIHQEENPKKEFTYGEEEGLRWAALDKGWWMCCRRRSKILLFLQLSAPPHFPKAEELCLKIFLFIKSIFSDKNINWPSSDDPMVTGNYWITFFFLRYFSVYVLMAVRPLQRGNYWRRVKNKK